MGNGLGFQSGSAEYFGNPHKCEENSEWGAMQCAFKSTSGAREHWKCLTKVPPFGNISSVHA